MENIRRLTRFRPKTNQFCDPKMILVFKQAGSNEKNNPAAVCFAQKCLLELLVRGLSGEDSGKLQL